MPMDADEAIRTIRMQAFGHEIVEERVRFALAVLAEPDFDMALADNVHLSVYGHEVVGQAILEFILEKTRP